MPEFFALDRSGTCRPGASLSLQTPHYNYIHPIQENLETPAEIEAILTTLFPGGLSAHGHRYLLDRYQFGQGTFPISPVIELFTELVRRMVAPDQPSRFSALFGCETLELAQAFRSKHGQPYHRIFHISATTHFRADMALLSLGPTPASTLNLLHKYWRGEGSANPFWEVLLSGPVHVLAQVDPTP